MGAGALVPARAMSTRSQLRFVQQSGTADEQSEADRSAQIYRHSNGYPDSVLRDLVKLKQLLNETRTERGPAYAAAQFPFIDTLSTMTLYVDEGRDQSIHADQPSDLLEPVNMEHLDQPLLLLGHGVENPASADRRRVATYFDTLLTSESLLTNSRRFSDQTLVNVVLFLRPGEGRRARDDAVARRRAFLLRGD